MSPSSPTATNESETSESTVRLKVVRPATAAKPSAATSARIMANATAILFRIDRLTNRLVMDMSNDLGGDCWSLERLNTLSVNEDLRAWGATLMTPARERAPSPLMRPAQQMAADTTAERREHPGRRVTA